MTDLRDRYLGCLLGLATGDALGTTLEFNTPGSFTPIADMIGGGPFELKPGEWTDDTSMALCLAESLIEREAFDPTRTAPRSGASVDQLERYVRWWREGYLSSNGICFDIGGTVRSALTRFRQTHEPYCGSADPNTAGNGSIMRLAPVPMRYARDSIEAIARSGESSRTTHGAPAAIDACRYFGSLIVGALNGVDKDKLLSPWYSAVSGYWGERPLESSIDEIAGGSFKHKQPPEIQGTGYVVHSLEAALWAFYRSDSFREGCLLAVNLGDDADTTGAVYGQLAGAYYGAAQIPSEWREKLAKRDLIERFAEQLLRLAYPD